MKEGNGYEGDEMLLGGPADGCLNIAIELNTQDPPAIIKRLVNGQEMKRETLGEKLIEYLGDKQIDGNQRVAVYRLRDISEKNEKCFYDYVETIEMKNFRHKYERT